MAASSGFRSNISPSVSACVSPPPNENDFENDFNENRMFFTPTEDESHRTRSQKLDTTTSMKSSKPMFVQENRSPPSLSRPRTAIRSNTTIATTVTPSPKMIENLCENQSDNTDKKLDAAEMPFIDECNATWRNHGKLFRANIVLADEGNGSNIFALSDSCAIERYYRVADRVLEQFLSSNIAKRNQLVESYLVGNRLFKFLSVVLPTHHQYFSTDPKLEELRNRSESQLMELLEYMEELELMIDEMEYNRYILNDLTPSKPKDKTGTFAKEMPQDEWSRENHTSQGNYKSKRTDQSKRNVVNIAEKQKMANDENQEQPEIQHKQLTQQRASNPNRINDMYRNSQSGNVKIAVQAIEASYQTKKSSKPSINDSPNHHQNLKQKVAAVVTASNNAELSATSHTLTRCVSNATSRSSMSPSTEKANFDFYGKNNTETKELQDFTQNDSIHDIPCAPKHHKITNRLTSRERDDEERIQSHESPGEPSMSWDADFSQFNVFTSEKIQGEDFGVSKVSIRKSPLLRDPCPQRKRQLDRQKCLPKIKEPPRSYPRSVWTHAKVNEAQSSLTFKNHQISSDKHGTGVSPALSDCSSDIFYALEDPQPEKDFFKTKIEERLECAMDHRNNASRGKNTSFSLANYENTSALEANSQRKLINQFRGCVRFLLD